MAMTHLFRPFIVLFALVSSLNAQDPLWTKAREQVLNTNKFVAIDVSTHTEIFDGDGKNIDTIDIIKHLTGWKNGEPVRSVKSLIESQKSGLGDMAFDVGVANHPEKGLIDGSTIQRQEEVLIEGKSFVVFLVTGKKGKASFTAKAWIEKATALPRKVDYTIDPSSISMTKALSYSISYGLSNEGHWLPTQFTMDTLMSVLFKKIKISLRQNLDGWVVRP